MLKFIKEKCTGCQLCALACSGERSGIFSGTLSNVGVSSRYEHEALESEIRMCTHCGTCVESCPQEALEERNGIISLDREKCVSCSTCADACPEKVIYMWNDYPVLCNLCGGNPWCVKMCPKEALVNEEVRA